LTSSDAVIAQGLYYDVTNHEDMKKIIDRQLKTVIYGNFS